jgi:hypothetical protein
MITSVHNDKELKDYRNHKSAKYELARTVEAWIDRICTFAIGQTLTSTGLCERSSDPQASRIPIAHSPIAPLV